MAYTTPRTWVTSELVTATLLNTHLRDNIAYVHGRANCFIWTVAGGLAVNTDQGFHNRVANSITFIEAEMLVKTAPTGASLIVDVNLNGLSLWNTTPANRPTIPAGSGYGVSGAPDFTAGADNDVLTMDVDQVGSTIAGSDLTVLLWYV